MARIVLHKGSDTKIVSLGPSLYFYVFSFLYLFRIKLYKQAFVILFIQSISSFMLLYPIVSESLLTFILRPLTFLIYTLYLSSSPFLLWCIIISLTSSNVEVSGDFMIFCRMLSIIFESGIFLISFFYCNEWYCKKLLEEGYSPSKDDRYSQQLLKYYKRKFIS